MTVWIYISGNLAAESMMILADYMAGAFPAFNYKLISDGFSPTLSDCQKNKLTIINPFDLNFHFNEDDLLLLGIMTPGFKERALLTEAKKSGCETIVFLNDIDGGAQKFCTGEGLILPDYIAVADVLTYERLLGEGIPSDMLIKLGSIYLDTIPYAAVKYKQMDKIRLGYFSVPNADDEAIWGKKLGYSEQQIAQHLVELTEQPSKYDLTIRKHPKERDSSKYDAYCTPGVSVKDHGHSTTEDFIKEHNILISSYSTALLVALKMGKPVISYQPGSGNPVRLNLYKRLGIPLVRDFEGLAYLLENMQFPAFEIDQVLFNSGHSLTSFSLFLEKHILKIYEG